MIAGDFSGGFLHPITGLDHVVAMVAVGLWGAQLGAPAIWVLPITFPIIMAVGSFLGIVGVPLPSVDLAVALSGVVLGLAVATSARPPLIVSALLVGVFGLVHGYAHGTAMPLSGSPMAFGGGFVMATGLLHLSGILLGILMRWPTGVKVVRTIGMSIVLAALYSVVNLVAAMS